MKIIVGLLLLIAGIGVAQDHLHWDPVATVTQAVRSAVDGPLGARTDTTCQAAALSTAESGPCDVVLMTPDELTAAAVAEG